jgi:[citrate (pro-3S)-lyase] ligase
LSGPDAHQANGFAPPEGPGRPSARAAQALIEGAGLRFEPDFDDLFGCYDGGQLVGCCARSGYVLKMCAIAPECQGGDLLGELATQVLQSALAAGHDTVFVFTRPASAGSFQALNFRLLAMHGEAALLEHGPGLEAYLAGHAGLITPGRNGAVVVNGNPFTLGHLHLVERAAREVDRLYLFVVREDRSVFPFEARFRLAREATAHLGNVTVLDTSRYAVSAGTFPSYFLRRLDQAAASQMGLDLELFARRLAPPFHIVRRFAGAEPLCPVTAAYNRLMGEILPAHGIQWTELPRVEAAGQPISATRVRAAFAAGDLASVAGLLPAATLAYLGSPEAGPIAERIRQASRQEVP